MRFELKKDFLRVAPIKINYSQLTISDLSFDSPLHTQDREFQTEQRSLPTIASMLPVAVYGLKVPAGDVMIPAIVDFPATVSSFNKVIHNNNSFLEADHT